MQQGRALLWLVFACTACSPSLDTSLEGKRCTQGVCLPGYTCSSEGFCLRASATVNGDAVIDTGATARPNLAADAGARVVAPARDASVATAPKMLDAASSQAIDAAPSSNASRVATAQAGAIADPTPPKLPTQAGSNAGTAVNTAGVKAIAGTNAQAGAHAQAGANAQAGATAQAGANASAGINAQAGGPPSMPQAGAPDRPGHDPRDAGAPEPPGCPAKLTRCDETCVDLESDSEHCGSCDNSCDKKQFCENAECVKEGESHERP